MASWGDSKLFFCLLFITCCSTVIVGQIAVDCCLEVKDVQIPKQSVKDYHHQTSGHGCSISAVIFVTRQDRRLCAPVNREWVNHLINHVNKLKEMCKKNKYKKSRCRGVAAQ